MRKKHCKYNECRGGGDLLTACRGFFGGVGLVKLLRYYGTKALRSNSWVRKPEQYSCGRSEPVICQRQDNILKIDGTYQFILNCQRQDNTLKIGGTYQFILNLIQTLKIFPILTLKGEREKLVTHSKNTTHFTHFASAKRVAFTLAEMMVVMLILTIILAAFSPLMTRRKAVDLTIRTYISD